MAAMVVDGVSRRDIPYGVMFRGRTKADSCAMLDVVDDELTVENGSGRMK